MRSTPGRPYPLIIPFSAGPCKRNFCKIVFSHRFFLVLWRNCVFTLTPEVSRYTAVGHLANPGRRTKIDEKTVLKMVRQKASPKRPLGVHGDPSVPKGYQKRSQNRSKNDFFAARWGAGRTCTKPHHLLCITHIGGYPEWSIFRLFPVQGPVKKDSVKKDVKMPSRVAENGDPCPKWSPK